MDTFNANEARKVTKEVYPQVLADFIGGMSGIIIESKDQFENFLSFLSFYHLKDFLFKPKQLTYEYWDHIAEINGSKEKTLKGNNIFIFEWQPGKGLSLSICKGDRDEVSSAHREWYGVDPYIF